MSEPAFPSTNAIATASGVMTQGHAGLTKRDLAALMAMQGALSGLLSDGSHFTKGDEKKIAAISILIADATLKALEGGAQ
jgi:hypothetical protein